MSTPDLCLPGGTLMTHLRVYDTIAPDGQRGGTPHVHLICSEVYVTLQGSGQVELLDLSGTRTVDLTPGSALVFSPGTIHRLLNPNSDLQILVIMQNSGLPEHGDNVPTFPPHILDDASTFVQAMRAPTLDDAYRRRDLAVEGFLALQSAFAESEQAGKKALSDFHTRAVRLMQPYFDRWADVVKAGPLTEAENTLHHLDALNTENTHHLQQARHQLIICAATERIGFCGHLSPYPAPT
ncbi:MAG: cupin [Anaerolineae bacterium]|nr:cupin [Anaerolineae bacterium]